ncbi:two component transcriptional regulator, LuxR family [Actinacidiphila guanduensis]|uniref:Two component transcriptional regulator, LuxR family n=1 Tax=Actinacidiphila guanduensis TaxID=310781 RepID=A0A1H0PN16_9ACTN|nr:two component transcriptional regulator, LuxR family [Actinacidiphila guanduensis]
MSGSADVGEGGGSDPSVAGAEGAGAVGAGPGAAVPAQRSEPGQESGGSGKGGGPIRVLLVDDEPLLRMAFQMVLDAQADIVPVGEAGDGAGAVRQARALRPDVVLMDVRMPGMDGIEATARIVEACPQSRVLILTTFDLDVYAFAGLKAGASGFLLKNALPEELLGAIRAVAAGDAVVAPRVTRLLLERFAHQLPSKEDGAGRGEDERLARLTAREREVLVEVGRGLSNSEIAETLHLAEATVKTHFGRILVKLELRDRVQAVVFAYETRLVRPG